MAAARHTLGASLQCGRDGEHPVLDDIREHVVLHDFGDHAVLHDIREHAVLHDFCEHAVLHSIVAGPSRREQQLHRLAPRDTRGSQLDLPPGKVQPRAQALGESALSPPCLVLPCGGEALATPVVLDANLVSPFRTSEGSRG